MKEASTINRRDLLFGATPAATAMILGASATESTMAEASPPVTNYTPTFFNPVEWSFINAAVGRLIPSDGPGPGGLETGVPEFIDRQMELPYGHGAYFYLQGPFQRDAPATLGYQLRYTPRELYRSGIAASNDACRTAAGKVFADLTLEQQTAIVDDILKDGTDAHKKAKGFFGTFRDRVTGGYYSTPEGWKAIGYVGNTPMAEFPGPPPEVLKHLGLE